MKKIKNKNNVEVYNKHVEVVDSTVVLYGKSFAVAKGRSLVIARDWSFVEAFDSSCVILQDESRGRFKDASTAYAFDRASLTMWGYSRAYAWDLSTCNLYGRSKALAFDRSIVIINNENDVKGYMNSTLIHRKDFTVDKVEIMKTKYEDIFRKEDNEYVLYGPEKEIREGEYVVLFPRIELAITYKDPINYEQKIRIYRVKDNDIINDFHRVKARNPVEIGETKFTY